MNPVKTFAKQEPVNFWVILHIIFTVAQLTALPVAPWLHLVLLIASAVVSALAARSKVTPAVPKETHGG